MTQALDWNDQRAFLAVLDGGSLSAAARALGIGQATVRARVEALEKALGTVLFTRSAQGLLPTDQAHALGDHVRAMAHASDAFQRTASAAPGEIAGTVRVSVGELIGQEVLPPMLARLRERHPDLCVEIGLTNATANLSEQEADIAVRMHAPSQDTLVQRKVGEMALGYFAQPDYLARRGTPTTLDDLAHHDIIGPDRRAANLRSAQAVLPSSALKRIRLRTDSHPGQLAAARAGLGIVVMPQPVGLADPRLAHVLPEVVVGTLAVFVVAHRDLRRVPRVRATFDHLADELTRYCRS